MSISFDPQSGHVQKGLPPALVLSHSLFNKHTKLAIVCPLTNTDRKIPFHLPVPEGMKLKGFVMVEQIKSIDYGSRKAIFIQKAPENFIEDVIALLEACIN